MNESMAQELLAKIRSKQADDDNIPGTIGDVGSAAWDTLSNTYKKIIDTPLSSVPKYLSSLNPVPPNSLSPFAHSSATPPTTIKDQATLFSPGNTKAKDDAMLTAPVHQKALSNIAKTLLIAGAGGAAFRGFGGLQNLGKDVAPRKQTAVTMPVPYEDDSEDEDEQEKLANPTEPYGLPYYWPSKIVGGGLAAYGGFKAIDALLDKARKRKTDDKLKRRKAEYENSLLQSYKQSSDAETGTSLASSGLDKLGEAFQQFEKHAEEDFFSKYLGMPNAKGGIIGAGLSVGIPGALLGYMGMNNYMRSRSKRALLQKAIKERARRRAQSRPEEIYAIPVSQAPASQEPETEY